MATDTIGIFVGVDDGHCRVPAQVLANALFDLLVAGKPRLFFNGNRVDVRRRDFCWCTDLQLACPLGEPRYQVPSAGLSGGVNDSVERIEPLNRFSGVGIGKLADELIKVHEAPFRNCVAP